MPLKNVQVIDSALNCTFKVYSVPEEKFAVLFPQTGQELEFIEDIRDREPDLPDDWWADIWAVPVERTSVQGIHGTLFYGLPERRKVFSERTWAHDPLGWQASD